MAHSEAGGYLADSELLVVVELGYLGDLFVREAAAPVGAYVVELDVVMSQQDIRDVLIGAAATLCDLGNAEAFVTEGADFVVVDSSFHNVSPFFEGPF